MTDVIQTLETAIDEAVTAVAGNAEAQGEGARPARPRAPHAQAPSRVGAPAERRALRSVAGRQVVPRRRAALARARLAQGHGARSRGRLPEGDQPREGRRVDRHRHALHRIGGPRPRRSARATSTASSCRSRACSSRWRPASSSSAPRPPLDVDRVERTLREARLAGGPRRAADLRARVGDRLARPHEEVPGPPPVPERAAAPSRASAAAASASEVQTAGGLGPRLLAPLGRPRLREGHRRAHAHARRRAPSSSATPRPSRSRSQHVRASSDAPSVIDASCLNALGSSRTVVMATTSRGEPARRRARSGRARRAHRGDPPAARSRSRARSSRRPISSISPAVAR